MVDEEDFMPTLEEAFTFVHPSLGFNIEIKFPGDDPVEFDAVAEADRILSAVLPVRRTAASDRGQDKLNH